MRKIIILILLSLTLLSFNVMATGSDSHVLDVDVDPINEVSLNNSGSTIFFNVNSADAGFIPNAITDNSTTLSYTTNQSNKKIIVSTPLNIVQGISIEISSQLPDNAVANTITLDNSNLSGDIVTSINSATGSCTIKYSVSVDENVLPDNDSNNYNYDLTYTMVDE